MSNWAVKAVSLIVAIAGAYLITCVLLGGIYLLLLIIYNK